MNIVREIGNAFQRIFRLWPAWIITLGLFVVVYAVAQAQIPVILFKAMMVTLGGIIGFWFHIWTFGHIGDQTETPEREKDRRMMLIGFGMIALALAV